MELIKRATFLVVNKQNACDRCSIFNAFQATENIADFSLRYPVYNIEGGVWVDKFRGVSEVEKFES